MAQTILNLGTSANDGTGDGLRDTFTDVESNFTDIYNIHGWGFYVDAESSPATQTITTTTAKLQIDGAGGTSNTSYLPREIRGSGHLWDTTNDKITPIAVGDGYNLRIDIEISSKTGLPTELVLQLDIGGGASPSNVIVERSISVGKTPPYVVSVGFPIFCLTAFNTNGGQLFLKTDTGTVTIASRQISIHRTSSGTA